MQDAAHTAWKRETDLDLGRRAVGRHLDVHDRRFDRSSPDVQAALPRPKTVHPESSVGVRIGDRRRIPFLCANPGILR